MHIHLDSFQFFAMIKRFSPNIFYSIRYSYRLYFLTISKDTIATNTNDSVSRNHIWDYHVFFVKSKKSCNFYYTGLNFFHLIFKWITFNNSGVSKRII